MKKLDISRKEAEQVIKDDKDIDKGMKKDFDLPADKLLVSKQYTHTTGKKTPTVYKFNKKPKTSKVKNVDKANLIALLNDFLIDKVENLSIVNAERLLAFSIGENKFELTLTQKRK